MKDLFKKLDFFFVLIFQLEYLSNSIFSILVSKLIGKWKLKFKWVLKWSKHDNLYSIIGKKFLKIKINGDKMEKKNTSYIENTKKRRKKKLMGPMLFLHLTYKTQKRKKKIMGAKLNKYLHIAYKHLKKKKR